MARQRAAAGYPAVFYDLIEGVRDRGKTFTFPCETSKKAQLMRFQLYDFIKACRKSTYPREQELGEAAYGLVFSISGTDLVISIRDNEGEALRLRKELDSFLGARNQEAGTSVGIRKQEAQPHLPPLTPKTDELENMVEKFMKKGAPK